MLGLHGRKSNDAFGLLTSQLYNEQTFYPALLKDLGRCRNEVIIESPFITTRRIESLLPALHKLTRRGVRVTVNTRDPQEHDDNLRRQAETAIATLQRIGVQVFFTGGHHRKLVVLDREVLYEGSLNVLSQNDSCEIMRRIESAEMAQEILRFTKVDRFLDRGGL